MRRWCARPHPHARIRAVDAARARAMPGVLGVFTGADCRADGLAAIPHDPLPKTSYDMKLSGRGRRRGLHRPAPAVARGQGAPCRRSRRDGRGRDPAAGARCGGGASPSTTRSCPASAIPKTRCGRARRWSGTRFRTISSVDTLFGDRNGDRRRLRARRSCRRRWISTSAASPACRSSRARRSAHYDADSGRYTLYAGSGGAVRQKRELASVLGIEPEQPARPVLRRRRQFRHAQPRLSSNSDSCCGRRASSAARSSSRRRAPSASSAIIRAAIWSRKSSWRSTATAASSPCARPISAMSARAACRSRRSAKARA